MEAGTAGVDAGCGGVRNASFAQQPMNRETGRECRMIGADSATIGCGQDTECEIRAETLWNRERDGRLGWPEGGAGGAAAGCG